MYKRQARREEGVYVAEGLRMCREFTPKDVEALYVTPSFESQKENREWLHSYSYEIVTEEVMKAMADTKTPQGVLAVARQKKYTLEDVYKRQSLHREGTAWKSCVHPLASGLPGWRKAPGGALKAYHPL